MAEEQAVAVIPSGTEAQASAEPASVEQTENTEIKEVVEETAEQKMQKAFDKRISRLTREKYQERAEREQLRRELDEIKSHSKPAPVAEKGEPRPEQFESWDKYIDARAEYIADKKIDEKLTARERQQQEQKRAREQQETQTSFHSGLEKAKEHYPDLEEVIQNSDAPNSPAMAHAIYACGDKAPDVFYYLAKNPDEAERISKLDPVKTVMAIAKLEAKLERPDKQVSKAPPPINAVGTSATGKKTMAQMSQAEFEAHRRKVSKSR